MVGVALRFRKSTPRSSANEKGIDSLVVARVIPTLGHPDQLTYLFKPLLIKLSDDLEKELFSHENVVKMRTLLTKFKQCYDIYSVLRPLCRHEVALFSIRHSSLGYWSPVSFPVVSIVPKFHVLTYHIPEKAHSRSTVGMEADHSSESIRTEVNSLNRTYHTVQIVIKHF